MTDIATFPRLTSCGHELESSPDCLGLMRDSSDIAHDPSAQRQRIQEDGYLFLPGYLDAEQVLEARRSIINRLTELDMLDPNFPADQAVPKPGLDSYHVPKLAENNLPLMNLLYAPNGRLMQFFQGFFAQSVRHFDFTWLRCVTPGNGTASHCDIVYMGRGTTNLYTAWTPLGQTPLELGGLMVLENSHKNLRLRETYGKKDVDSYCENRPDQPAKTANGNNGWLSENPAQIRRSLGGRWLTSSFSPGDVVIFGMYLVHGGLDNQTNRLRLSSDSRYQRASEPADPRWIGPNPPGHSSAAKRGRIC